MSSFLSPPIPQLLLQTPTSIDLNTLYSMERDKKLPGYSSFYNTSTPSSQSQSQMNKIVYNEKRKGYMFKIAVISTILFIILSNPFTYTVLDRIYTAITNNYSYILNDNGYPTLKGTLINATIYFILIMITIFLG